MPEVSTTVSRDEPEIEPDRVRRCVLFEVTRCGASPIAARRIPLDAADTVSLRRGRGERIADRRIVVGVDDDRTSTDHAEIVRGLGSWTLRDRGSKNGSFVNGRRADAHVLADGDVIELGHTFFVWRADIVCPPGVVHRTIDDAPAGLATVDPELERAFDRLRSANRRGPVLITGESGTGKELVARAIHGREGRNGPLVAIDCGTLPPAIAAAELFGSRRGAYSGAEDRRGLIRAADGGTLFLDEIGNLPDEVQVMLLRVLETGEMRAMGATEVDHVDVEIIAATNADLRAAADAGRFRFDLFQRLAGHELALPAIRRRRVDAGLIVAGIARTLGVDDLALDLAATRAMFERSWRGNARELRRSIEIALAGAGEHVVRGSALPDPGRGERLEDPPIPPREQLDALLAEHRGNLAAVARALHTSRSQIHRLIDRFGIDVTSFRR